MSIDELSSDIIGTMSVEAMSVGKMSIDNLSVGKMSVEKFSVDKVSARCQLTRYT